MLTLPLSTPITVALIFTVITIAFALFAAWWARRSLKPFELEATTTKLGDWTWRYHSSGRGPNLILLHGIGANLYCWRWLIPLLAPDFRIWALDLPGFGGSSKPKAAAYGLDEQITRVLDFMDRMKIQQSYIIGNSMGGNIALWLAHEHPRRILGVGVIAPATSPKLIPLNLSKWVWMAGPMSLFMNRTAIRWAHRRTVSKRELIDGTRVEETFKTYVRQPDAIRSFMRATEAIRDPRLPRGLKGIKQKVLLLWGSNDLLVSKKVISDLESALPEAESHIHEGGGHHLQEDDPDWVARKIVEFFYRKLDVQP